LLAWAEQRQNASAERAPVLWEIGKGDGNNATAIACTTD